MSKHHGWLLVDASYGTCIQRDDDESRYANDDEARAACIKEALAGYPSAIAAVCDALEGAIAQCAELHDKLHDFSEGYES